VRPRRAAPVFRPLRGRALVRGCARVFRPGRARVLVRGSARVLRPGRARVLRRLRAGASGPLRVREPSGQAAVELVVLLPVAAAVLALAWQALIFAQAAWEARVAARAAARAQALGADAASAARAHLPARLERGLRVRAQAGGDVRVSVRVPVLVRGLPLGSVGATSHFDPQDG
jgi:hypothetical protein